jgi:hypothetical protein
MHSSNSLLEDKFEQLCHIRVISCPSQNNKVILDAHLVSQQINMNTKDNAIDELKPKDLAKYKQSEPCQTETKDYVIKTNTNTVLEPNRDEKVHELNIQNTPAKELFCTGINLFKLINIEHKKESNQIVKTNANIPEKVELFERINNSINASISSQNKFPHVSKFLIKNNKVITEADLISPKIIEEQINMKIKDNTFDKMVEENHTSRFGSSDLVYSGKAFLTEDSNILDNHLGNTLSDPSGVCNEDGRPIITQFEPSNRMITTDKLNLKDIQNKATLKEKFQHDRFPVKNKDGMEFSFKTKKDMKIDYMSFKPKHLKISNNKENTPSVNNCINEINCIHPVKTNTKTKHSKSRSMCENIDYLSTSRIDNVTNNNNKLMFYQNKNLDKCQIDKKKGMIQINNKLSFKNGDIYQGDTEDKLPNGFGVMKYINGDYYKGNFKSNKKHGYGTYFFKNGNIYEGSYLNNQRNGEGIFKCKTGRYLGDWVDDLKNGKGIFIFINGDEYEGEFKNDLRSGYGVLTNKDGDIFEGQWLNDRKNGHGKATFNKGTVYKGEWVNGIII